MWLDTEKRHLMAPYSYVLPLFLHYSFIFFDLDIPLAVLRVTPLITLFTPSLCVCRLLPLIDKNNKDLITFRHAGSSEGDPIYAFAAPSPSPTPSFIQPRKCVAIIIDRSSDIPQFYPLKHYYQRRFVLQSSYSSFSQGFPRKQ